MCYMNLENYIRSLRIGQIHHIIRMASHRQTKMYAKEKPMANRTVGRPGMRTTVKLQRFTISYGEETDTIRNPEKMNLVQETNWEIE